AYVLGPCPVITLGLDVHLPLAAEPIEVVDKQPAHECLDRSVDVVEGHTLLDYFVSIYFDELLRHARQEGSTQAGDLGTLTGGRQEYVQVIREERDILAGAVLETEVKSAGSAHPRNRRLREADSTTMRMPARF